MQRQMMAFSVLSPAQETHATLMLRYLPKLAKLRYKLCPSKVKESEFWVCLILKFMIIEMKFDLNVLNIFFFKIKNNTKTSKFLQFKYSIQLVHLFSFDSFENPLAFE